MKKLNRIERSGASAPGQAQGKRPTKTRTAKTNRSKQPDVSTWTSQRLIDYIVRNGNEEEISEAKAKIFEISDRVLRKLLVNGESAQQPKPARGSFPCHRLAPRTLAELRELLALTVNLGKCLVSHVSACGDIEHLFQRGDSLFIVSEWLNVEVRGIRYSLAETLSEHCQTLSEYVERRRAVTFMRRVDFDAPNKEEIARWAEEKGVAGALPLDVKRQLWGWDEADEKPGGRLVVAWQDEGEHYITTRCGVFTESPSGKQLTRREVFEIALLRRVEPAISRAAPAGFRGDFRINYHEEEWQKTADPADVLNG